LTRFMACLLGCAEAKPNVRIHPEGVSKLSSQGRIVEFFSRDRALRFRGTGAIVCLMVRYIKGLGIALLATSATAAAPTLDLQLVANQLTNVVAITHAGDGSGRLFVVQQNGLIKIVNGTNVLATPFLNISSLLLNSGEQGLLGLAFDLGYSTNGNFFVYYTHTTGDSNIVARFTAIPPSTNVVSAATRSEVISITHTNQANHNGGCIQFGPDGYLYIATGDGGAGCDTVGPNNAQNLNSLLGKLLRLDVNTNTTYRIPVTNPFVGFAGLDEIWAYGLRNPWRFSFDRLTGDLFIGDVGQDAREEVDFQIAGSAGGQNYGWNCMEGFLSNTCAGIVCATPAMIRPILDYDHSSSRIAIVGGYRYRGAAIPPLVGTYLYADEKGSGPLYGATQSLAGVWSSILLTNTPFTITTFGEDERGELYLSRYSSGTAGAIYRIVWKDTDADGLPDDWEQQFFGSTTGVSTNADVDGDGFNNLQEFQAGTDPTNAASFLRITATGPTNADWHVAFPTVSNKLYRLERNSDLATTNWVTVTNNIAGTGNTLQILDPGAASQTQRFYRVRLLP
jgi:glucose/arabinose dehydrogenase